MPRFQLDPVRMSAIAPAPAVQAQNHHRTRREGPSLTLYAPATAGARPGQSASDFFRRATF